MSVSHTAARPDPVPDAAALGSNRVLLISDDAELRRAARACLRPPDYELVEAADGAAGLSRALALHPVLIVLDLLLPRITGLEVCERLRSDAATDQTPIIMLGAKTETADRVRAIRLGADDYLVQPVDMRELAARLERLIERTRRDRDASPLTGLPGNIALEREIARRITQRGRLALVEFDLDHFKPYNDYYNYRRGDRLLQLAAQTVTEAAAGDSDTFVAHIGGDDFFVVTSPECAEVIAHQAIKAFDAVSPLAYDEDDRVRGSITAVNREGIAQAFPLVSMSVCIATNEPEDITHPGQLAEILAELKAYAKRMPKSLVVRDRRQRHKSDRSGPEGRSGGC